MEPTIVVLLDAEKKHVQLFGDYNVKIPFYDLYLLPVYLDGREVLYVLDGVITDANEVIEQAVACAEVSDLSIEPRYFHTTQDGYLKVADIKLSLAGKRDAKPISQFGVDVFEKSPALCAAIRDGKIEIISESQAKALKKQLPAGRLKDKALDEILVNTSVQDMLDRDDFEEADMITSEQGDVETETEANIRKIEQMRRKE